MTETTVFREESYDGEAILLECASRYRWAALAKRTETTLANLVAFYLIMPRRPPPSVRMNSIGSVFLFLTTKISNFAEKKEMVWILGTLKFLFAAGGLFFTWLLITNFISAVTNPDFEERDGKLIEKGANARSVLILITSICWGLVIALP